MIDFSDLASSVTTIEWSKGKLRDARSWRDGVDWQLGLGPVQPEAPYWEVARHLLAQFLGTPEVDDLEEAIADAFDGAGELGMAPAQRVGAQR